MKYLGMVHIGKLACVAIHNLEATFTIIFTVQSYFIEREIIYNAKKMEPPPLATHPTTPTNLRSS